MFTNTSELKEFLTWAKAEGIAKIQVGDIAVEFSALALLQNAPSSQTTTNLSKALGLTPLTEEEQKKEDEELLFASSQP